MSEKNEQKESVMLAGWIKAVIDTPNPIETGVFFVKTLKNRNSTNPAFYLDYTFSYLRDTP